MKVPVQFKVFLLLALFTIGVSRAETFHWNQGRGYAQFLYSTPEGIMIHNQTDSLLFDYFMLPVPTDNFTLKFRSKNFNSKPAKKYPYYGKDGREYNIKNPHWGFFIICDDDTVTITVKNSEKFINQESVFGSNIIFNRLSSYHPLDSEKSFVINASNKIDPYSGDNLWNLSIDSQTIKLSAGNNSIKPLFSYPFSSNVNGFGFFAGWGSKILISDITARSKSSEKQNERTYDADTIDEYFNDSDDPMEGYWTLFDREIDESLIKLGGFYTLACVREGEDYMFLYVDGANVNADNWHPGEIKAVLSPSQFPGIYLVEWRDAMKEPMKYDIKSQKGEGDTLLIQFPYQASKIRLRKIPKD